MKLTSNQDFAEQMMQLASDAEPFVPTAAYDPDGDCIELLVKADTFYAERVDNLVTVYYSHETNEITGSLIKGVSKLCQKLLERSTGVKIRILDGRVSLEHIFIASLESHRGKPSKMVELTYKKLIQVARKAKMEAEVSLSVA
jgi:hypothetical protein